MSPTNSAATQPASTQRGAAGHVPIGRSAPFREPVGPIDDVFEREADRVADAMLSGNMQDARRAGGWAASQRRDSPVIRRAPVPREEAGPSQPLRTEAPAAASAARIVADEAAPGPGQMKKGEFMAALRSAVCANVDAALAGTGRDSQGCPWIDHWLGYYEERPVADIERALRRYAPEAAEASEATAYIRAVAARVRRSAQRWAKTGELTDLPADMPGGMPGGGVLAGFGGMFFKARAGGPRQADAVSVRQELGSGDAMGGGLRARMEGVFGTSFVGVRIHTDATAARLANRLNARAFAVGPHIAFGGSEFRPGTLEGDALIAHELAHVVQQGQGHISSGTMHKGYEADAGEAADSLEHDADLSAAGATARLWGGETVPENAHAARPRLRSGLRLQRCASTPKAPGKAGGPQAKLSVREQRDAAISGAGERLREVDSWVSAQQRAQRVPDIKGVRDLDAAQAANVTQAIELLVRAESLFGTKSIDALPAKLDDIVRELRDAKKFAGASGGDAAEQRIFRLQQEHALRNAITASNEATEMVAKIGQTLDVDGVRKHTDAIASGLNGIDSHPETLYDGVEEVVKNVKAAKEQIRELRARFDRTPKALGRILFLLRSFLALNAPGRSAAPTAAEIVAYKASLKGSLADDFSTVFGEGKAIRGFDVFVVYAEVLDRQLAELDKMAAANIKAASPVPTQGNAEDYFRSLKGKKGNEVFAAYMAYASAFFYHRVVDTFNDMDVNDVSELYQRPLSIVGLRPLVCTGYALLGSHLLKAAGAKLKDFIVAVRAEDEDIVGDRIDAGHALAHMSLDGREFWISNDLIVFKENDGIGEDAVAWGKSHAKLRKASGPSIRGANAKLRDKLGDLASEIRKRSGAKKK